MHGLFAVSKKHKVFFCCLVLEFQFFYLQNPGQLVRVRKEGIKVAGRETGPMPIPEGHTSTCALSATIDVLSHIGVHCNQQLGDVNWDKSSSV